MRGFCGEIITRAKLIIDLISGRGSYGTFVICCRIFGIFGTVLSFLQLPKKGAALEFEGTESFSLVCCCYPFIVVLVTMDKYRLRRDLVTCPHCGSWHPRESICVHCYDEVRRETNALRASLRSVREGLPYDQETQFLYDQETFGKAGAYTHRVNRKRPSWFPANLLGLPSPDSPSK
uniref:39S ribosomal protein L32, mitochondrial n=1 Tax=Echinococcus granulosus TaxID=6210 RepID=A0A068WGL6_ECHGR|nr:39S ribosomal protein L32, mitochondrial [Echinococcus granulosus]